MKLFGQKRQKFAATVSFVALALLLVGCGSANTGSSTPSTTGSNGKGCKKIGVLLPETATSARWDGQDRPLLQKLIPQALPGATVDYSNAQGDADTQQNQAESDLTKGDCMLVVAPSDSTKAAAIVSSAKAQGVPVIAYDRLIQSKDLGYYVSFDGVAVGKVQGDYVSQHYKNYVKNGVANTVMINGSQTDNNAILFNKGALQVLQPLFDSKALTLKYQVFTPGWDNPTAQTEMEAALTANQSNIQIAYVANDGMAQTVIAALKSQKLNGKVLVTGQDATVAGIQNILTGDQSMTVEKAYSKEAQATANLVAAISNGTSTSSQTNGITTATKDGGNIPSVLEQPVAIDKTNFRQVITDGLMTAQDICKNLPASATPAGLCS